MKAKKINKLNGLSLDAINQVNDTQSDMTFLNNVLSAYLEGSLDAKPVDIYGFIQICVNINKQLELCEKNLEKIRGVVSS